MSGDRWPSREQVAAIMWRVPVTTYVYGHGGWVATCETCEEYGLQCGWVYTSQAAAQRWLGDHRDWHRTTAPGGDGPQLW